jgi:tetratricopeptide (TPR) repeat protein
MVGGIGYVTAREGHFGFGVVPHIFPEQAVDFLEQVQPETELFCDMNWAGYALWRLYPAYRVFTMGRIMMYPYPKSVLREYLAFVTGPEQEYRELEKRYNIRSALVPYGDTLLLQRLENRPDWQLAYIDETDLVYLAKTGKNREILKKCGYRALHPGRFPFYDQARSKEAYQEILRAIDLRPDAPRLHYYLSVWYYDHHQDEQAMGEFQKTLNLNPGIAGAYKYLGSIYFRHHQPEQARQAWEKALELGPDPEIQKALAALSSQDKAPK